jgi:hypothetical protein
MRGRPSRPRGPVVAPPTPPAASRATACAPTRCPSRSSASAPSRSCRTSRARRARHTGSTAGRSLGVCIPTATCPIPAHESSQVRSAQSARSYEGIEHPAKPTAARRSWPRGSSTSRTYADHGAASTSPVEHPSLVFDTVTTLMFATLGLRSWRRHPWGPFGLPRACSGSRCSRR